MVSKIFLTLMDSKRCRGEDRRKQEELTNMVAITRMPLLTLMALCCLVPGTRVVPKTTELRKHLRNNHRSNNSNNNSFHSSTLLDRLSVLGKANCLLVSPNSVRTSVLTVARVGRNNSSLPLLHHRKCRQVYRTAGRSPTGGLRRLLLPSRTRGRSHSQLLCVPTRRLKRLQPLLHLHRLSKQLQSVGTVTMGQL